MITLTRAYYFSASHRLHVAQFSAQKNQDLFGKCNNPHGHGHNYRLEISVRGEMDQATGRVVDLGRLDTIVNDRIVKYFDHKYINQDLPEFATRVATTEVLGEVINERLQAAWPKEFPKLEKVGIQETLRNRFTIPASI
jgi:6-pyruvoyltetrahydropterin/6-carboxytetrahydropterin synthase